MTLPAKNECIKLFQRYVLFSNVEEHCVTVATVAMYLAEKIKREKKQDLNLDLVFALSLFHDLGKAATIKERNPEKYKTKPLTKEQEKTWKMLHHLYKNIEAVYKDLQVLYPDLQKKAKETDVLSVIIGPLFPDLLPYIHQIGGTRNPIYFDAGMEIKIIHYADWISQGSGLISLEKRLDYLFDTYFTELTKEQRQERKKKEFLLEKEIFEELDITPDSLNVEELNKKKEELFEGKYDYFEII